MSPHFIMADSGLGGLFNALGLNLPAFLLNLAAFIVTAWVVGKYVFPPITKALDAKREELEAAVRLEADANKKLETAGSEAAGLIRQARDEADTIIATAKADAAGAIEVARKRAGEQGERLVAEAREQLARDVLTARRELKIETARLVAGATEAVLDEKLDSKHDAALVARSLEEVK
jgi:F-type H+-transporting ATPase subunit b